MVSSEIKSADVADNPVMTMLNPIRRAGFMTAERYIFIMAMPLAVSHSVMAAVNASGRASSAATEMPASAAEAVSSRKAMVEAVSKPSPNKNPST